MASYIGITIGPIGDTMDLTSTPAGLWASSYLFSYLAHEIRAGIGKADLIQDDLENGNVRSLFEKGVGLYHDRIIYKADDNNALEKAIKAIDNAVRKIVDGFADFIGFDEEKDKLTQFFDSYFNIHTLCLEIPSSDNFLLKMNDALDAAELEKNFPAAIDYNPILLLFDGYDEAKNEGIKNSFLVSGKDEKRKLNWVLTNRSSRQIKDLKAIASCEEKSPYKPEDKPEDKAAYYYAVIRADGDNMGKTIKETINNEADYIEFTKKCFRYGCNTAETVLQYCGIPIFVGGDDLLCIVPLMCKIEDETHTFLELIKKIRDDFKEEFREGPDLSFGVQIQYVKAPLYEALNEADRLLFSVAKNHKPGALAVNIRKHSGQSAEILIKDIGDKQGGERIRNLVDELILTHTSEETLKSVGKHVADFSSLLEEGGKKGDSAIDHFFTNIFDNEKTDEQNQYLDKITDLTKAINYGNEEGKLSEKLGSYIRVVKFFSEKVDREEVQ